MILLLFFLTYTNKVADLLDKDAYSKDILSIVSFMYYIPVIYYPTLVLYHPILITYPSSNLPYI